MRNKLIIFIIALTAIASLTGFLLWQKQSFSKDILELKIIGPEKADVGEEFEYVVKFKNNGDVRLEDLSLVFEYPTHSIPSGGESLRVAKDSQDIGDIYPGEEKIYRFKARLLGEEGEVKEAKASLVFRPKNLKAKYSSKTVCATVIRSAPITFDFDLTSKMESGQNTEFYLNYFSNIDYPLSDLGVEIEYPSGFQFIESSPISLDNHSWEIASLNKTEGGRIKIKGILSGEAGNQKMYRAKLGIWQDGEFVILKEIAKGVEIVEPSLDVHQTINGSSHYNANLGDSLHYEIYFRNIGNKPFENLFLALRLKGELFDFQTIRSDFGKSEAGDNSIIWDWRDVSKLRFLAPGEEGKVEFWVNLKKSYAYRGKQDKNLVLSDKITLSQVRREFTTKVNSILNLTQKGYIDDELFQSEGPMPPKVEEKSFFTIIWNVSNYYNDLQNVKVKAILPEGVELSGKIFPDDQAENMSFDSKSRELVWNIGDMSAGEGISGTKKMFAFQIALTPKLKDVGASMALIKEARIIGEDIWTGTIIEETAEFIDTCIIKQDNCLVK